MLTTLAINFFLLAISRLVCRSIKLTPWLPTRRLTSGICKREQITPAGSFAVAIEHVLTMSPSMIVLRRCFEYNLTRTCRFTNTVIDSLLYSRSSYCWLCGRSNTTNRTDVDVLSKLCSACRLCYLILSSLSNGCTMAQKIFDSL